MNMIMNKVVEEGTGKRAILEGIKAAGKTGTTNAYRDAWFVGYTGNYVAGVWFGNDDYSPTNRMTGGSLPAQTWREIMAYAHQGIEVRPIPGVPAGPTPPAPVVARTDPKTVPAEAPVRPAVLTKRAVEVLLRVERLLEEAGRPAQAAVGEDTRPERRSQLTPSPLAPQ
jgi:penicillin-binding protein 1A